MTKTYDCVSCPKSFGKQSDMVSHTKKHKKMTFTCNHCSNGFVTKAECGKHIGEICSRKPKVGRKLHKQAKAEEFAEEEKANAVASTATATGGTGGDGGTGGGGARSNGIGLLFFGNFSALACLCRFLPTLGFLEQISSICLPHSAFVANM